jgi:hypothetical protein
VNAESMRRIRPLEFDSEEKGSNSGVWWQDVSAVKDFRYSMRQISQTTHFCIRMSIGVWRDGHPTEVLSSDLISTCEQSGCRDLSLSRSAYACQPSPSQSPTERHSTRPSASPSQSLPFEPSLIHGSQLIAASHALLSSAALSVTSSTAESDCLRPVRVRQPQQCTAFSVSFSCSNAITMHFIGCIRVICLICVI